MDYSKKSKEELIKEIASLKKKEEDISIEKNKHLAFVLENIEECIYNVKFTPTGKVLSFVSPHIYHITGLNIKEFTEEGKSGKLAERINAEDRKIIKQNIRNNFYINKCKNSIDVFRFKPKGKKKYCWIEEKVNAKYDEKGNLVETTSILRDITKQKEQQELLKASEKRFNILSNATNEVVLIHKQGKILDINNSVKQIFGYEPHELIGKNAAILTNKDSIDKVKNSIISNKNCSYEAFGVKKDGTVFFGEVQSKAMTFKNSIIKVVTIRDVSERKTIELFLKENEEKYKNIFTQSLAGVFITEKNIIIDCNNSFAKIFGYKSRVQLIGKKATSLYFATKEREDYIVDLKKKNKLTNYRIKHKKKDGSEIWILTNVTLKNNRINGTLIDITEQVRVENLLKQNEKNYKDLTENSPYGIFVHKKGVILYANKKATQILGIKTKEKINIFNDFFYNNKKEAEERAKKALNGEDVPFKEFKVKPPFSDSFIYLEIKPVLFDYQGEKAIQVVFKDITIEKQLSKEKLRLRIAEESNKILQKEIIEREKIEKKLIENQKYTKSIINSSIDIICASDKDGKIIEFNAAAEQAFGYKEKEIIKKGVQLIYASKQEFIQVSKQLKNNGIFVGEVKNKRKNGETFTSFLSASVLYNEDGLPTGTMGVSRDVTQLKIVEQQLIDSEEKYRDLFENATHLIQSVDKKGNIVYVNKAWKNALGYSDHEIEHKNIFEIVHPDCLEKCKQIFFEVINSKEGKINKVSYELKTKKGEKIIVEGNVSVKYKNGKPDSTRAILRDVTGEMWNKLLQSVYNNIAKIITEKVNPEEIYEAIRIELGKVINTDVFAISYVVDEDTLAFPYYYDTTRNGRIFVENRHRQKGLNEYLIKYRKPKIIYCDEWNKITLKEEYKIYGPKAEVFIGVPLKVKNKVIGVVSVQSYNDKNLLGKKELKILNFISGGLALTVQRKYDEQLLFEQTSKLTSIIENSSHLFWTYDKNIGLTSFNQNYSNAVYDLYGSRPQIIPGEINRIKETSLQPFWDKKYDEAFKGKKVKFITERINTKGKRIIREVFLNPIFGEKNKVVMVSGIAHDITDKQIAEEKLKKSLFEKEILLKEVHHRVKNNLQVISSILSLQASYVKEESTLTILKESKDRIKTMAFIHESLYQTNDFSKINFSEYVVNLSKNLVHSYGILDSYVDLILEVEDVSLNLDLSIPCGLIINELVSNALKYAFLNTQKAKIKIELFENKDSLYLIVQDNGIGFPNNINYEETDSLGLQLVMTLVEQINGTIKLENTKGTKFTIIFKKE